MTVEYFQGTSTYLIYAEDTAWGTAGTPSASNKFGKVTSATWTGKNNFKRTQGIGDGRNATVAVLTSFDINGTIEMQVDDFTALQYVVGKIQGAGTIADPYELVEVNNFGYDATNIPSLSVEFGSEGDSNDDVSIVDGVVFNTCTISASSGDVLTANLEWIGRNITSSTTLESYTAGTSKPFVFQQGAVTIGTDTFHCSAFSVTIGNDVKTNRDLGSRFIAQPVTGKRTYDFSLTFRMKHDNTASVLSGTEIRDLFYGASNSPATGGSVTAYAVSLDITEGAANGDRVVNIDLENCYFEDWSNPVQLDNGFIEVTVNGFGLAGLSDSTDKVPIRWYQISA